MADDPARPPSRRRPRRWRDAVEPAALCTAVTVADAAAKTVVHAPGTPAALGVPALAPPGTAALHTWRSHRPARSPAPDGTPGAEADGTAPGGTAAGPAARPGGAAKPATEADGARAAGGSGLAPAAALWRPRTTVREQPGALAALCTALAGHGVDVLSPQTHPLGSRPVDDLLLRAPAALAPGAPAGLAAAAGGSGTCLERADAHDPVDVPARVPALATRTARDAAELPLALRELLGRRTVRWLPAGTRGEDGATPREGVEAGPGDAGTVLRLPDADGGALRIERPALPFTPAEYARARDLAAPDARLGRRTTRRTARSREPLALPEGGPVTVRRAGPRDLAAATALHGRCSRRSLALRYHGPTADADRYLAHLLTPRFGRTLAAQTASGRLVALGHLMWDGEEAEVALLVEDACQGRGIGGLLLARLVATAAEARCDAVYAITHTHNTPMVAAMRRLRLPLDHQIEEGTLVLTARLGAAERPPSGGRGRSAALSVRPAPPAEARPRAGAGTPGSASPARW